MQTMNLSLEKIRSVFPQFNKTAITDMDFWRAAKKHKVIVRTLPLKVKGYYKYERGRHYILIDSRLSPLEFLHTALHEFCHYLFESPRLHTHAFYKGVYDTPEERFADAFALIAMLPMPDLIKLAGEDVSDDKWLLKLCQDRIAVRAYYGI